MNEQALNTRIYDLSERDAIAFMAALVERMLINFRFYVSVCPFEGARRADSAIGLVWESLLTRQSRIDFTLQGEKLAVFEQLLDEQGDDSFGAQMAGDALVALSILLESLATERRGGAIEIAQLSRHGVIRLITLQDDDASDQEALDALLEAHPLTQDERAFEEEVLDLIAQEGSETRDAIQALRRLGQNEGVSNLGLTLEDS